MLYRISHLAAGVGLFVALALTITVFATETHKKYMHQDPMKTRNEIIQGRLELLKSLKADAEFMSVDQELAMGTLATYRSTEAAPRLIELIMVKRSAKKKLSSLIAGSYSISGGARTRIDQSPQQNPAVRALVAIGLASIWAIRDKLDTVADNAQPKPELLELYAKVICGVFPDNQRHSLMLDMKERALKKHKLVYETLLKRPDMNPSRIIIHLEPDIEIE